MANGRYYRKEVNIIRTLKKTIILGLAAATKVETLKNNKLLLVTPFGLVSGYLCDEENVNPVDAGAVLLNSLTKKLTEDFGKENIDGNDGYLILSDVAIRTSENVTFNCPNLIVFYDQIIGATLGSTT